MSATKVGGREAAPPMARVRLAGISWPREIVGVCEPSGSINIRVTRGIRRFRPKRPCRRSISVRRGVVGYVGVSNYADGQLAKAIGVAQPHGWEPLESLQLGFAGCPRCRARVGSLCQHSGLAVLPWSPLGRECCREVSPGTNRP